MFKHLTGLWILGRDQLYSLPKKKNKDTKVNKRGVT
jgi:hypothetical protein